MIIANLKTIAEIAEEKRVRIELLPKGFCITARAPVLGKGMVEIKQIITYDKIITYDDARDEDVIKLFELVIDETIERLKLESRKK